MYYFPLVKARCDGDRYHDGVQVLLWHRGCPVNAGETGKRLGSEAVGILIPTSQPQISCFIKVVYLCDYEKRNCMYSALINAYYIADTVTVLGRMTGEDSE